MANELWVVSAPPDVPDKNCDEAAINLQKNPANLVIRATDAFDLIEKVKSAITQQGTLGTLNIVGHGLSGRLRVGSKYGGEETLLEPRYPPLYALADLLPLFAAGPKVRLLGCNVALTGTPGSGPMLQLALSRVLGARVEAPLCGVFSTDFSGAGLSANVALASIKEGDHIDTDPAPVIFVGPLAPPNHPWFNEDSVSQVTLARAPALPRDSVARKPRWPVVAVMLKPELRRDFVKLVKWEREFRDPDALADPEFIATIVHDGGVIDAEVVLNESAIVLRKPNEARLVTLAGENNPISSLFQRAIESQE